MYGQIRYGVSDWTPEFIAGIVLLAVSGLATQYRVWTSSKRIPVRYMEAFPPPPDFYTVNSRSSQIQQADVIV
jgi:hypothetical protein